MITSAILSVIYVFILAISQIFVVFGDVSTNNLITESIVTFKTYYVSLAEYLPLGTILAIVAFDLVFEGFVLTYKLVRWGYNKVPSIN